MDNEENVDVSLIKLAEAFQKVGLAAFGKEWIKDCWRVGYYPLDEHPPYVDKSKIDPEELYFNPVKWGDVVFAPKDMISQFEETQELLSKSLWSGDIHVSIIDSHGKLTDLDRSIWRDSSGRYAVSWSKSELLSRKEKSSRLNIIWSVEVALSDVEKMSDRVANDRQERAVALSQSKPRGAGRKEEINWEVIDPILIEIHEQAPSSSQPAAAARLERRLEEMGWGRSKENRQGNTLIPSTSSIVKRIRKLKKDNKINY